MTSIREGKRYIRTEPPKPLERVMIFIDGGYLRGIFNDVFGDDDIDYRKVSNTILGIYNAIPILPVQANLIRTYYYDAIVDEEEDEFKKQREYFESIRMQECYTVRLGYLVKSAKKKFRQKGVDILMAIDALTMAYRNYYDAGMFVIGDRDFVPLIDSVKNAGKKTIGVFHRPNSSMELMKTCDMRIYIIQENLEEWHIKK